MNDIDIPLHQFAAFAEHHGWLSTLDFLASFGEAPSWVIDLEIPAEWLLTAFKHRGKTLHLAIVCWIVASELGSDQFALPPSYLKKFHIQPDAASRALAVLEKEGLIDVVRNSTRVPVITLNREVSQ